jgi:hypothetical protein
MRRRRIRSFSQSQELLEEVGRTGRFLVAAGLTYSARLRRLHFEMLTDFNPALRALVAAPALSRGVYRPVVPAIPTVEAVFLDKDGRRSIALMNWSYRCVEGEHGKRSTVLPTIENLRVDLPGVGRPNTIRSLRHGNLPLQTDGGRPFVVPPELSAIDLLVVE